jgi:hypothetical protein
LKVLDLTDPEQPKVVDGAAVPLAQANNLYISRGHLYVAAGSEGLAIFDVTKAEKPELVTKFNAGGQLNDARDVKVGMTNTSIFAYVADGKNGLRVVQLTSPAHTPGSAGFNATPTPELIATYPTSGPALYVSEGIDRDRAVDETGHQTAVFGRIGARPFTQDEMKKFYMTGDGEVWKVGDAVAGQKRAYAGGK